MSLPCRTFGAIVSSVIALLGTSSAFAQEPLRTVPFADVKWDKPITMDAARAWRRAEQVGFELDGGVRRDGDRVSLAGWIVNASAEPQLVVIFPVGTLGFLVQPAHRTVKRRLGPPMPPPAPPPPLGITLPAQSRMRLESAIYLSDWEWNTEVPREIEWTFQFWMEPKPKGRLLVP
jgi:hypothetical protein